MIRRILDPIFNPDHFFEINEVPRADVAKVLSIMLKLQIMSLDSQAEDVRERIHLELFVWTWLVTEMPASHHGLDFFLKALMIRIHIEYLL